MDNLPVAEVAQSPPQASPEGAFKLQMFSAERLNKYSTEDAGEGRSDGGSTFAKNVFDYSDQVAQQPYGFIHQEAITG